MSYIQKTLAPGETVIHLAKISLWSQWVRLVLGVITLPAFGLGAIFLLAVVIKYISTELAITDRRIIAKYGFIRRSSVEIALKKVESIQIRQGIIGRIFNYGTVIVAGSGNPQAPVRGISNPMAFRASYARITETQDMAIRPVAPQLIAS